MQADFWHERWNQNEIGFHQDKINVHLQNYWDKFNIPSGSKIFVPLCGKSRDMLWLRAKEFEVLGVEISPLAVKGFFSENDLEPQISNTGAFQLWYTNGLSILLGDFFELNGKDLAGCNAVYDRASLIALPPQMRKQYAEQLMAIAPEINQTLLITFEYDQNIMQGPPFSVTEHEVRALFDGLYQIEPLYNLDVLEQYAPFRERGLTQLREKVYQLTRNPESSP